MQSTLILASASPRRRELLEQMGIHYQVHVADVDESPFPNEPVNELVERLARLKARTVWQHCQTNVAAVLGADTLGVLDGQPLSKPVDEADALAMLRCMSGRWHDIFTAVALITPQGENALISHSRVKFRSVTDAEIRAYWNTGEPRDKAGAYAIQGRGAVFVERLEGSYSGVMGLPIFETAQLLHAADIAV